MRHLVLVSFLMFLHFSSPAWAVIYEPTPTDVNINHSYRVEGSVDGIPGFGCGQGVGGSGSDGIVLGASPQFEVKRKA